jgi:hypothetical protein
MIELLIELVTQIVGNVLIDYLVDRFAWEGFRSVPVASLGHLFVGAILGLVSLRFLPHPVIQSLSGQIASLVVVPAGLGMVFAWRENSRTGGTPNGYPVLRFISAASLALGFGVVRFFFAK